MNDNVALEGLTMNADGGGFVGGGSVAAIMLRHNWDPGALRPYYQEEGGPSFLTLNKGKGGILICGPDGKPKPKTVMANNANATLHYNDWKEIDRTVHEAVRPKMRLANDLRQAGLVYNVGGGMGRTTLQSQTVSDTGPAELSMDGRTRGRSDRPEFGQTGIPLVIAHRDFQLGAREIATSKQFGEGIDTTEARQASVRVAEMVEQLVSGEKSYSYGGYTVYGYTTHPNRLTKELTDPTDVGWTASVLVTEILDMRQKSIDSFFDGPWVLYVSRNWGAHLEEDYVPEDGTTTTGTLRDRLRRIEGISDVRTANYLPAYDMVLVAMVPEVVRLAIAMELVTLQWPGQGGMELNFKIMAIIVPQIRADINLRTGLVHGAVVP